MGKHQLYKNHSKLTWKTAGCYLWVFTVFNSMTKDYYTRHVSSSVSLYLHLGQNHLSFGTVLAVKFTHPKWHHFTGQSSESQPIMGSTLFGRPH